MSPKQQVERHFGSLTQQGYILGDIVPNIYDGDFLADDLAKIAADPSVGSEAPLIHAFLDQIAGSTNATWELLRHSGQHHDSPYFNCKAINCFQNQGFNLYRVRPLKTKLQKYRIIYAFDAPDNSIYFLAVVIAKKDTVAPPPADLHYDYSQRHPISLRITKECNDFDFGKL